MLVPMTELLRTAQTGGYAVPGFNYYNQATAEGIVDEAQALGSPVILMISGVYLDSMGMEAAAALGRQSANRVSVPVALHLDHGGSYELAQACIKAGFTSVMIDGSHLPYEENVTVTRKVVELAHSRGVTVEAELGAVGGIEDAVFDDAEESHLVLIDPSQAADFVSRTGIDCLAPAIGNVHGMTKAEPRLDIPLLRDVRSKVDVPLVLHGGSGISEETIREIIGIGISKVNVGSELKIAWREGLQGYFATGKYEPRMGMQASREAVRKTVAAKINLFGSTGKA